MKLSVVTISFNQAKYLRKCIDSVLTQDYPDIEYIIVDPGSTDGSREIIDSYGTRVMRVYEKDNGPADGLNKGFSLATGDIFYFINSDDYILPSTFSNIIRYFKEYPSIDIVLAAGFSADGSGVIKKSLYPSKVTAKAYVNGAVTFFQQGMFFKSEIFKSVGGFNAQNKTCWDGELLLSFILSNAKFKRVMSKVAVFRIYPDSITGSQRLAVQVAQDHERMFQMVYDTNQSPTLTLSILYRVIKLLRDPVYFINRCIR